MLAARLTTDIHARRKKGQPTPNKTIVAISACTQRPIGLSPQCATADAPNMCAIDKTTAGTVNPAATHIRKVISRNSAPSSAAAPTGSKAMPQRGQSPAPSCITSGCMGHV